MLSFTITHEGGTVYLVSRIAVFRVTNGRWSSCFSKYVQGLSHQETGWEVHIYIGAMFNIVYSWIKIDGKGDGEVMDATETSGLC